MDFFLFYYCEIVVFYSMPKNPQNKHTNTKLCQISIIYRPSTDLAELCLSVYVCTRKKVWGWGFSLLFYVTFCVRRLFVRRNLCQATADKHRKTERKIKTEAKQCSFQAGRVTCVQINAHLLSRCILCFMNFIFQC